LTQQAPARGGRDTYLQGAFTLAAAAMFSRILGAVYRIPLGRVMGDYGMGLFGAGYTIYMPILGISTAGINVAISKVMAEKIARSDERGAYRAFRISLALLAVVGLVSAVVLGLGAHAIADRVMRNPDAYYAILALAPAIFLVAIEGSLRGYFQGYQRMTPPAISQVIEQFFRMASLLILAYALLPRGNAIAAGGAAFGATVGAVFGSLYLVIPYYLSRRDIAQRVAAAPPPAPDAESTRSIVRRIVLLAVPISIAAVVVPLFGVADLIVVPLRLQSIGFSVKDSTRLFGQLSQMAMVLINLPAVVTYGLQTSLVPAISEAQALGDRAGIRSKTSSGLRATFLIGLPAMVGLWLLATPICELLYRHGEAGVPLAALSGAVLFLMVQQTTSGVLQGLGRTDLPVRNLIIGALVKGVLAWVLTGIPELNIRGAAYSTTAGFLVASVLNLYEVHRHVGFKVDLPATVLKPLGASAAMGLVLFFGFPRLLLPLGNDVATLALVAGGGLVYAATLLLLGGIRERDFAFLPVIGARLARLFKDLGLVRE